MERRAMKFEVIRAKKKDSFFSTKEHLIFKKFETMSVSQPADSGGASQCIQNLQVEEEGNKMNTEAMSWAQLMEQEEAFDYPENDEEGGDEVDGGESSLSPESRRKIPEGPPYRIQVTNLSSTHIEEEILYLFGNEQSVKKFDFHGSEGKAEFEFFTQEDLKSALEKHEMEFQGKKLKVFARQNRESVGRVSSRFSQENQYGSHDSQPNGKRNDSYRGSHYNSQSSLSNSDRNYRQERNFQRPQQYGTMPAGGFKKGYDRNHKNQGYYDNSRNSFRPQKNYNTYDRQNSQPQYGYNNSYDEGGPLQRSGSYQSNRNDNYHHNRNAGPISARSRTESHSTNLDSFSRTSSRMSLDDQPKQIQRKPSANPFGDAKPVDTQARLLEIEKRKAEKEKVVEEVSEETPEKIDEVEVAHANKEEKHQYKHDGHKYQHKQQHQQHSQRHNNNKGYQKKGEQFEGNSSGDSQRYEQGAPIGSITIKKRESIDVDKKRESECISPPIDPVQSQCNSPLDSTRKESTASASKQPQNLPPQHPNHQKKPRSAAKLYNPHPNGGLQKSATIGHIGKLPKSESEDSKTRRDSTSDRKYNNRGGIRNDQTRRSSFSGSEGGRQGDQKTRGITKRGGRGNRTGGRGGIRNEGESRKTSDESNTTISESVERIEEKKTIPTQEPVVKEKESVKPVESTTRLDDGDNKIDDSVQQSTPKKKTDKKKEKKKEAKNGHMSTNKFSALMSLGAQ